MSDTIQPITPAPVAKKPLTKKQKAAIATGAVVTTVALGSAVAAYALGKNTEGVKLLGKLKEGYKAMPGKIAELATGAWQRLTGLFKKGDEKVAEAAK